MFHGFACQIPLKVCPPVCATPCFPENFPACPSSKGKMGNFPKTSSRFQRPPPPLGIMPPCEMQGPCQNQGVIQAEPRSRDAPRPHTTARRRRRRPTPVRPHETRTGTRSTNNCRPPSWNRRGFVFHFFGGQGQSRWPSPAFQTDPPRWLVRKPFRRELSNRRPGVARGQRRRCNHHDAEP